MLPTQIQLRFVSSNPHKVTEGRVTRARRLRPCELVEEAGLTDADGRRWIVDAVDPRVVGVGLRQADEHALVIGPSRRQIRPGAHGEHDQGSRDSHPSAAR